MNKEQQKIVSEIMIDHVQAEIDKRLKAQVPHTPEEAKQRADELKALKAFLVDLAETFE